ncbi:MAG: hypothetical protein ACK5B9_16430 [Flavobacteriia bacterium]|jgi:hypothetical protein
MKTLIFLSLSVLLLFSCSKQERNKRMFAGNWVLKNIITKKYLDNQETESKDTSYYGVMQLQNTTGVENHAYFTGFVPFPSDYANWDVSDDEPNVIRFYLMNLDMGVNFSYNFTVNKINSKKLILTSFVSDNDLNVQEKYTWEFTKE